jgi:sirohydrochlorin cobaltochelatase
LAIAECRIRWAPQGAAEEESGQFRTIWYLVFRVRCFNSCPMSPGDFSDAALVLVGHGSTLNADSAAPTYQHADELRRRGIFGQVVEAFWKLEPSLAAVLRGVCARRVFIVPLFISEGYFTEEVIPRELGVCKPGETSFTRMQQRGAQTLYYCGPVGTHDSMTEVLLARARGVVAKFPNGKMATPGDTALFIAGHGTANNENSRKAIERQVELIRARNVYAEVHPAFMEEEPRIGQCYQLARTRNIVMVPFFISDGLHSYEDIPVMLGEPEPVVQERFRRGEPTWRNPTEKHGKQVWYASSIGSEPHIAEVILERVREAAGGNQ